MVLEEREQNKTMWVGALLSKAERTELVTFLKGNMDVFYWSHKDMPGIAPEHAVHRLKLILPSHLFVRNREGLPQNEIRL